MQTEFQAFQQFFVNGVARFGETVVPPLPLFAPEQKSGLAQVRQVPRYFRLRHIQHGKQIAHAQFAVLQQRENAKPRRVSERPKRLINRMSAGSGFHVYIRLSECIHFAPECQLDRAPMLAKLEFEGELPVECRHERVW